MKDLIDTLMGRTINVKSKNVKTEVVQNIISYTTRQGGQWTDVEIDDPDVILAEVQTQTNWGRYKVHPEQGDKAYTVLRNIPGHEWIRVHSVRFPDGRVWDSTLRKMRE